MSETVSTGRLVTTIQAFFIVFSLFVAFGLATAVIYSSIARSDGIEGNARSAIMGAFAIGAFIGVLLALPISRLIRAPATRRAVNQWQILFACGIVGEVIGVWTLGQEGVGTAIGVAVSSSFAWNVGAGPEQS